MKSGVIKKIELAANVLIIFVAVLLGVVLVQRFLHSESAPVVTAGTKISLPGVDWSKNNRTLLLVLQKDCHFCSDSAHFYQQLSQESKEHGKFRLLAVLPQSIEDGQKYLNSLNVSVDDIRQASLELFGVRGTPTLMLVNNTGVISNIWTGKLSENQQSEVLAQLREGNDGNSEIKSDEGAATSIEAIELKRLIDSGKRMVILDVDTREVYAQVHINGAKNIPSDELIMRADRELPASDMIVLYCRCTNDEKSENVAESLRNNGYAHILVLRGGFNGWRNANLPVVSQSLTEIKE